MTKERNEMVELLRKPSSPGTLFTKPYTPSPSKFGIAHSHSSPLANRLTFKMSVKPKMFQLLHSRVNNIFDSQRR